MNKLTYDYIKNFIESVNGYTLISTEYINTHTKLDICCPFGHTYKTNFTNFKYNNNRCPVCAGNKKHNLEYVKKYIEREKYKLLSVNYINSHNKLEIMCNNGHIFLMSFSEFKNNGHRCNKCSIDKIAYKKKYTSFEKLKSIVENNGYMICSDMYIDAHIKIKFKCPEGHVFEMRPNNFQQGQRCPICSGNIKYTHEYVENYIEKEGYFLLSNKYNNNKDNLKIKCKNGHIFKMSFSSFLQGQRCPYCVRQRSTQEIDIFNFVKSIYNGTLIPNDRKTIYNYWTKKWLELDIYLPEDKIAIEYNGYYHTLPIQKWKDEIKKCRCKKLGINLFVIQHRNGNWNKNKEKIFDDIESFLKKHNVCCARLLT
jgi:hypothetical protein